MYMTFGLISKAACDLNKPPVNSIKQFTCPKIIGTSSDCVPANASSAEGHARYSLLVGSVGDTGQVHSLDTY
jgi:hypothetical protein